MNYKILKAYMIMCRVFEIEPTFTGLKRFNQECK